MRCSGGSNIRSSLHQKLKAMQFYFNLEVENVSAGMKLGASSGHLLKRVFCSDRPAQHNASVTHNDSLHLKTPKYSIAAVSPENTHMKPFVLDCEPGEDCHYKSQ